MITNMGSVKNYCTTGDLNARFSKVIQFGEALSMRRQPQVINNLKISIEFGITDYYRN